MVFYYEGKDISADAQITRCVHRDVTLGRSDCLDLEVDHAAAWYQWHPLAGDCIRMTHGRYDTGDLYIHTVHPAGDRYRILASSLPPEARQAQYKAYRGISFKELVEQCAAECGLEGMLYGFDETYIYRYLLRDGCGAAAFLQRLCKAEGAVLKIYNGRLCAIRIHYAQEQKAVRGLNLTGEEESLVYTRAEKSRWAFLKAVTPDCEVTARDSSASDCKGMVLPLPAHDAVEAGRWARGLLLMHNRAKESLELSMSFDPAMTAMAKVEVNSRNTLSGDWLVEEAEHDLKNERTRIRLARCLTSIQ